MAPRTALLCTLLALGLALTAAQNANCVTTGLGLLSDCQKEQAYITATFPLTSPEPITQEQVDKFVAGKPADLPTKGCCDAATAFLKDKCQCDKTLLSALPPTVVTPAGLNGTLQVVGKVCKVEVAAC
ncbi:hypothetical protein COHA_007929 [Chlorella ohadii]|uniref:Bifunctional inhibitor/plant lipid transfer protein/seed storage helical domain-containing protein n=1 Tax=Chlorella ohadii TaxID=2649997 RepID=A0AAD5DM94_9CHLO|nr:hypothetical protein COHA_007929 [Chlorella ohadii]